MVPDQKPQNDRTCRFASVTVEKHNSNTKARCHSHDSHRAARGTQFDKNILKQFGVPWKLEEDYVGDNLG